MDNCESCPTNNQCSKEKDQCMIENNPMNNIKHVIGVMSGKGGVGKSSVSVLIAKNLKSKGFNVGILDADISGPSIPRLLGVKEKIKGTKDIIFPAETKDGIKVVSLNLLIEDEMQPVIWRGPILSGTVKQFWTNVLWEELDYLIIDMPPGTTDVAITVMQSVPMNGLVMVSVPQDMVSMIVGKSINMARKMNINVLGVVENMSYLSCPECGKKVNLFNGNNTKQFLEDMKLTLLGEIPMVQAISHLEEDGYIKNKEIIDQILNPIVGNILNNLK